MRFQLTSKLNNNMAPIMKEYSSDTTTDESKSASATFIAPDLEDVNLFPFVASKSPQ